MFKISEEHREGGGLKAGERGTAWKDKELRTQGWSPGTGGPVKRKRSVLQKEEGSWPSRCPASVPRPGDPTGGGSECVEGSRGQWGLWQRGNQREGRRA